MKLNFISGCTTCYHGLVNSPISELMMVRGFKHRIRNKETTKIYNKGQTNEMLEDVYSLNGGVSSKVGFRSHIAMMDVDHKDFKDVVTAKLREMEIPYFVVESSPKRYWVVADKFVSRNRKLANFLINFPEVDTKYITCGRSSGFNLRAYPKGGFRPHVVEISGVGSKKFTKFLRLFNKYWDKPHISWIINEYIVDMI